MTSVRPKLKPETPKAITGWDTATGSTLWLTSAGDWSTSAERLAVFTGEEADQKLERAIKDETQVTDPYFMEVSDQGEIVGRERLRETIRANGPTSHPEFSKQGSS